MINLDNYYRIAEEEIELIKALRYIDENRIIRR